jgi:hypothetical protein
VGRDGAAEQQPGSGEPVEPGFQFGARSPRHPLDQVVAELTTNDRADLCNLLGD